MKLNKNIFISVLLVLVMLSVIGAASATDSLDNNLTAENTIDDAVSVDAGDSLASTDDKLLGDGETIIYVDGSYSGEELGTEDNPYKTISSAVGAATAGGETIFIKDGEYTLDAKISFTKSINIAGESRDGVIIKSTATNGVFETVENGVALSFKNLNFEDISAGSIGILNVGGDSNLDVINCTFANSASKWGVMWIKTTGTVNIEDVEIINTTTTTNKGATAIYFQGAGTYNVKNTLIDNAQHTATGFAYAPIYTVNAESTLTMDNVEIYNCGGNVYGMVYTNGNATITNSRFINNTVPGATGNALIYAARNTMTIEQSVIVNNSAKNYLVFCNTGGTAILNYNYIANNTLTTSSSTLPVYGAGTSGTNTINADSNYWGSNSPAISGTTVNNYVIVNDAGDYVLNTNGQPPEKAIPSIDESGDEPDEPIVGPGDENTTWVSVGGNDNNTGAADSPVATIAKAVEIAKTKSGEIIINEGTYTESGIVIDSNITISITGIGNVVIDGNASANSIFTLGMNPSATFTNIKFRNNKPQYGGAIYAQGNSQNDLSNINVTVNNCTFEDMDVSKRGGAIYLYYAKGNLLINDSKFDNCSATNWGGAICTAYCSYTNALNLVINGSTFEGCFANNGGCLYLFADTITVNNSVFNNNSANFETIQFYNATTFVDNCIITNNVGLKDSSYSSPGVAIKITTASTKTPTVTITNSVIENNNNQLNTYPAIYVDRSVLDISYSSLVNDLSIETKDGSSSAVQGVAIANNNWWGTNDPSEKVKGKSITMDNWVIMNVIANVTEAIPGDEVKLTVDFNHVNTTAGEIEELTGGVIPKTYTVQLTSNNGTIVPATLTIKDGATKDAVYTVGDLNDVVSVSCDEALVEMTFVPEVPPYYGIIYVSKDGNDNNDGSEDAPVETIAKAVELATVVGGSHEIIINEGTYTPGASIVITDDLTITGNGAVVIDADGIEKLIEMPYSSPVKGFTVVLNNLTLINGVGNQYATVYNYADAYLFMNNVNISDCTCAYNGGIITTTGNTTITDSVISDCTGGSIIYASVGYNKPITVTLINTTLKDNTAFIDDGSDVGAGYAIIHVSTSTNTVLNLIDSHITGNTGKLGTVYTTSDKVTMNVNGTEFINNAVLVGSGGAINGYNMNIDNSTFIKNAVVYTQGRDGGAIYIGRNGNAVITNSKFVDNSATGKGNTIYNGWGLTINNCVILDGDDGNVIYHNGVDNVMDANYNWWGTNDDPAALIGVGEYEDDSGWGYADCEYDASKWVIMNVVNNLTSTDPLNINDTIEFTVDFNHYTDSTGTIYELPGSIPEVEVSASAIKGAFDEQVLTTENGVATFIYTADVGGEDTINIISSNAVYTTVIEIIEPVILEVVYVGPNGDDSNPGYYDEPVATIAHAIEIAERGKIVIFEGTYTINATLGIEKDMDIRGEGTVIIDGDLTRILENTANLNLTNLIFTNGKLGFAAAILNDGNVTIDGCTFYNNTATASTSGNIINNRKGSMTINNSVFYENVASRGAVASQAGTNLVINNSEFYDNDMSLSGSSSYYGIVYSTSADTIVENTVFRNNKAKQGAGIWATRSTSATTGSLEVINCTFENNIAEIGTGGAIFASGKVTVDVYDSTFINNTATKSASGVGGNGGAIYSTGTSDVTVIDSVFIDNAGIEDAGIYAAGNTFDISNSVILAKEGDANYALNVAGATVTANDNFWGDNSKANTNANVAKWVIMSATYDNETGALDITFDKTNSTAGVVADYEDVLPDGFNVTVTSSSGALDETLPVIAGQASTTYFTRVSENITVKCSDAEVVIEVIVVPKVIYVARDGDDNNTGSRENPVATIAKAIELADEGRIVILSGTYPTGDLGIISNDLNITGEGTVIIDAQNANRLLYVGSDANVVLRNLIMINGAADLESGALIGNSNYLTLINCTLANSSAGIRNGGAIYNVGKLTIINSTIANNTARVGGAIFNDYYSKGTELTVINSTFENNIADGDGNNGGGAIFAQKIAGLTIINTTFTGNEALSTSSGGAIGIIYADADFTIADSAFIANHANGQESTGGGAIYIAGTSNNQRSGSLTITNTLFEENTADNDGAAIYARATTLDVSNSVIFANKDPAGFAVFGYKTDVVSPAITLNDNWWGTNDDPNDYVGGYNYHPTLTRWVILTATNETPIVEGSNTTLKVSLDTYTDGETTGTLATPITIPRTVFIETTFESIEGVMENGEFTIDYLVPADLKLIEAYVDTANVVIYKVKEPTTIDAEAITGENGDTIAINITVISTEGAVGYAAVVVQVGDNENSTYYADETGNVVVPIEGMIPGSYEALIVFEGDDDFLASNATVDVLINKRNTTIVADAISNDNGDTVAINVTVMTLDGASVGVVPVTVVISDVFNSTFDTDENGNVVVPISGLDSGKYLAEITFEGNDYYFGTESGVSVLIKTNTTIIAEAVVDDNGDTVGVNVTVKTVDGDSVGDVLVTITVGDVINSTYLTEDGQIYIPIDGLNPGSYVASIVFDGDGDFTGSDASVDVFINKFDTILTAEDVEAVYKDGSKFIATLTDVDGNAISDAKVKFSIPGAVVKYIRTDSNGQAILDLSTFKVGKYTATLTFAATDMYNKATAVATINIKQVSNIVAGDIETVYNSGDNLTATLTNDKGEAISGASVTVELDGVETTYITDENGQIFAPVSDVTPGTYTASIVFDGDDHYNASSTTAEVTVTKGDTIVTSSDVNATHGVETYLVATLTDANGNPISGEKIKFVIPHAVIKYLKTDENGQVALNVANFEPGKYTATITFVATDSYNKAVTTAIIIVAPVKATTLVVSDLETAYNSGDNITATLTDENGQAISGAEVAVQFAGINTTLITDENGQVSVSTDDVVPGDYSAEFTFAGSEAYEGSSASANVAITTMDTVVNASDITVTYKDGSKLIATLTDANGKVISDAKIKFAVSGKSAKYIRTDANGQAALSLANYEVGSYKATITFVATDLYNKSSTTARIIVNEA